MLKQKRVINLIAPILFVAGLALLSGLFVSKTVVFADPNTSIQAACEANGGVYTAGSSGKQSTCTTCDTSTSCTTMGADGKQERLNAAAACTATGGTPKGTGCTKDGKDVTIIDAPTAANTSDYGGDCTTDPKKKETLNAENCGIVAIILDITNILSALVGIVVVIMIAIGGIQYTASRDNPQATAAAKEKIRNAILALVVYLFTYALLQYLIPGGIF